MKKDTPYSHEFVLIFIKQSYFLNSDLNAKLPYKLLVAVSDGHLW